MPSGAATALLVCVWQCRKGPALCALGDLQWCCAGPSTSGPLPATWVPRRCHVAPSWMPFSSATLTVGVPAPLLLAAAAKAATAPPWQYWIPLQNRGWAAGTPQHLPRDVHAGGQALKMPGCKSERGVRWRRRRRRRHRTGTTLAQLGPLQNRGWAAGRRHHLPGDVHARRQAQGVPGCRCGRGGQVAAAVAAPYWHSAHL